MPPSASLLHYAAVVCGLLVSASASAAETPIGYRESIALARTNAPDLAVARGRETVSRAEVGIAGIYPNPSLATGTSTLAAKLSVTATVPLVVFGQRGAAIRAGEADLATTKVETEVSWNDIRAATAHAFVTLWLAQRVAEERKRTADIARRLDDAVTQKFEAGAIPELDALRAHAERLRAEADVTEADETVNAAASELGRWVGAAPGASLRAAGDPDVPRVAPLLNDLLVRIPGHPGIRREASEVRAADARAARERALVRPTMLLDVGTDIGDPTLSGANYRAQLAIEVPVFNARGPYVDRERAFAAVARARATAETTRLGASVESAYHSFLGASARSKALEEGVVPAADAAAVAAEAQYEAGRAPLVTLLEALRARVESRSALVDLKASRANAWIEVEHLTGAP